MSLSYTWSCFKHFLRTGLKPLPDNTLREPNKYNKSPLAWGTIDGPKNGQHKQGHSSGRSAVRIISDDDLRQWLSWMDTE